MTTQRVKFVTEVEPRLMVSTVVDSAGMQKTLSVQKRLFDLVYGITVRTDRMAPEWEADRKEWSEYLVPLTSGGDAVRRITRTASVVSLKISRYDAVAEHISVEIVFRKNRLPLGTLTIFYRDNGQLGGAKADFS